MNIHTKQEQDKMFETDFIDSQTPHPHDAHFFTLSHIYIIEIQGHSCVKKIKLKVWFHQM